MPWRKGRWKKKKKSKINKGERTRRQERELGKKVLGQKMKKSYILRKYGVYVRVLKKKKSPSEREARVKKWKKIWRHYGNLKTNRTEGIEAKAEKNERV